MVEAAVRPRCGALREREDVLFVSKNTSASSGSVGLDVDGVEHSVVAVDSRNNRDRLAGDTQGCLRAGRVSLSEHPVLVSPMATFCG